MGDIELDFSWFEFKFSTFSIFTEKKDAHQVVVTNWCVITIVTSQCNAMIGGGRG